MKLITIVALIALVLGGSIAVYCLTGDHTHSDNGLEADSRINDTDIDTGVDDNVTIETTLTIVYGSGTADAYSVTESGGEQIITFSGLTEDTSYSISGTLKGCIIIDAGDYDFELVLDGTEISSSINVPICINSGDEVDIKANKGTVNYVYDNRQAVGDDDISAAIYALCDLDFKGKGKLVVISENNKGIHTKDDLSVKNLTLYVTCVDNALKGNDSVTITSGTITLNAVSGDGIKTSSTDLSKKNVQRGTVTINSDDGDTDLTIKAYCDGIDAAFDVTIEETSGSVTVDIISGTGAEPFKSTAASFQGGRMPGGGWGGMPGGNSWNQGGPDSEGNSNKASYSCKGIKAGNEIVIKSGTIIVDSYDDCLHSNNDDTMESGAVPTGNITITGGTITLNSKDDGVHADETLLISGGTVTVTGSFEGLEGNTVSISGGNTSIISSDDGINATCTSGTGISVSGGKLYVYAKGDGMDSNSRSSYSGIVFSDGETVVISYSGMNSSIDSENGYSFTGGKVLAICSQGMTQEVTHVDTWNSKATSKTITLSSGKTVTVTVGGTNQISATMPVSISNAYVVYLGSNSATISVS